MINSTSLECKNKIYYVSAMLLQVYVLSINENSVVRDAVVWMIQGNDRGEAPVTGRPPGVLNMTKETAVDCLPPPLGSAITHT